ncbi:rhodanese-like domain-containing protein [Lacticaseibacillus songhuajiangensis]|jgi:rhodanese-related sulfurtransferase|uniref:rhodanese-like domain-containing protein n=1 Tax=Lacticaseibacillus songhuajiangensis TaxID=1296539 RepID=UPI000F7AF2FB|nr:rhodanese-like domain-containing protein [Lacticaseibacillus songhuajiangensis]
MFGLHRLHTITTDDLTQRLQNPQALLLDVREPAEYRAGHIAKAKNVPLRRIADYTPPADKQLYVICRSGDRSKQAARILQRAGVDVINVRGGMLTWKGTVRRS